MSIFSTDAASVGPHSEPVITTQATVEENPVPMRESMNWTRDKSNRQTHVLICLALVIGIAVVYWRALGGDFIGLDDGQYIVLNKLVKQGITLNGLASAFTKVYGANWHPLTWISHMMDCQLYGLHATGHHITSMLFHMANTLLLFVLLRRMTGRTWQSAFVAALFAIHPINVESVAWISERKNVLSTFFCFLTIYLYISYVRVTNLRNYLRMALAYLLGLMSKPMIVTLPILFVLLDCWPLGRLTDYELDPRSHWRDAKRIILEKLPLLMFALGGCVTTIRAQAAGGAISSLADMPIIYRVENALVAYVMYIWNMLWPTKLGVEYAHPGPSLEPWQYCGSGLLLLLISVFVLWRARRNTYCAVGWLWYLVSLIPVIGIVKVGSQSMADRYAYIPLIGLFVSVTWGIAELAGKFSNPKEIYKAITAMAVVILLALGSLARSQAALWLDTILLYEHAVTCTRNTESELYLARLYNLKGDVRRAEMHLLQRIRIYCNDNKCGPLASDCVCMAHLLIRQNETNQAMHWIARAGRAAPDDWSTQLGIGYAFVRMRQPEKAILHFTKAQKLSPNNIRCELALANTLMGHRKMDSAIVHFRAALRLDPRSEPATRQLAKALYLKKDYAGALQVLSKGQRHGLRPNSKFVEQIRRGLSTGGSRTDHRPIVPRTN